MKSATPKFSPPSAPKRAPCENFAKKKLTPRDYLYKHCVSKSATYIKKKYENVTPKFSTPPAPRMFPCEIFVKKIFNPSGLCI